MKGGLLLTLVCTNAILQILNPRQIVTDAILGGVIIFPGLYKSLVFLSSVYEEKMFPADSRVRSCGGTLIGQQWVLTAAHCFHDKTGKLIEAKDWAASFGVTNIGNSIQGLYVDISNYVKNNKPWLPVQRRINKIYLHPLYQANDYYTHDIALLLLSEPVPINNSTIGISPLPIPGSKIPIGTKCGCAGWGCQFVGGDISLWAARGTFPVSTNHDCRNLQGTMTDEKMCAGYGDNFFSICQGDSGGPLICYVGTEFVYAGIASYNSRASPLNEPNVFTRVSSYVPWILKTMGALAFNFY